MCRNSSILGFLLFLSSLNLATALIHICFQQCTEVGGHLLDLSVSCLSPDELLSCHLDSSSSSGEWIVPPLAKRYSEASYRSGCAFPRPQTTAARLSPAIIDPFSVTANNARGPPMNGTDPMLANATEADKLSECPCINELYYHRGRNFEFPFPTPSAALEFRDNSIRACHEAGGEVQLALLRAESCEDPRQPPWLWDVNYNVQSNAEAQTQPAHAILLCVLVHEDCFLDLLSLGFGVDHWMNSRLTAGLSSPLSWVYKWDSP